MSRRHGHFSDEDHHHHHHHDTVLPPIRGAHLSTSSSISSGGSSYYSTSTSTSTSSGHSTSSSMDSVRQPRYSYNSYNNSSAPLAPPPALPRIVVAPKPAPLLPGTDDLSIFTFLMAKFASPHLSHLPEETTTCVHMPHCHCSSPSGGKRYVNVGGGGSSSSSSSDLVATSYVGGGDEESCSCDCPLGKLCQNSLFGHNAYSLLKCTNLEGCLIRSLERGVLFPVIHWSAYPAPPPNNLHSSSYLNGNPFGSAGSPTAFNQGVYRELKRCTPPDAWIHHNNQDVVPDQSYDSTSTSPTSSSSSSSSSPCSPPSRPLKTVRPTWLILGYKSLEKTLDPMLLATWKDWTGTRHIYLNLRHDFDIQRISFFHKVSPRDNLDLFMYLVTMEIGNVTEDNVMWLLDFVQRTRVERMKGYLTVYTEVVEERDTFPMLGDDYFKYLNVPGERTRKQAAHHPLPLVYNNNNRHRESKIVDGQECDHEYDHPSKKFIEKLLQELPLVEYY